MKTKLIFGALLATSLLASCGGANSSATNTSPAAGTSAPTATSQTVTSAATSAATSEATSEEAAVLPVYELRGSYDELYNQFAAFEFYGLLYSDGSGILYEALVSSSGDNKNKPALEGEPVAFRYKVEDDDGIETFNASINGTRITGYKNADGLFNFEYSFKFAGSYTRTAVIYVSDQIGHETVEDWLADVEEEYASRVVEVTLSSTYSGAVLQADETPWIINFGDYGSFAASAKFELYSDFSVKASYGVGGSNGGASFEGAWGVDTANGNAVYVTIGEERIDSVADGAHEYFIWEFSHQAKDGEGNPVGDPIELSAKLEYVEADA